MLSKAYVDRGNLSAPDITGRKGGRGSGGRGIGVEMASILLQILQLQVEARGERWGGVVGYVGHESVRPLEGPRQRLREVVNKVFADWNMAATLGERLVVGGGVEEGGRGGREGRGGGGRCISMHMASVLFPMLLFLMLLVGRGAGAGRGGVVRGAQDGGFGPRVALGGCRR